MNMYLKNRLPGERIHPLEELILLDGEPGQETLSATSRKSTPSTTPSSLGKIIEVSDGRGQVYLYTTCAPEIHFLAGGYPGIHTITCLDENGNPLEKIHFRLQAYTQIQEDSGIFSQLLDTLYFTMADEPMEHFIRYHGKTYYFFVNWLRDHVHTMKGMKYFEPRLTGGIELYRDSQRSDGMIWDNVHRRIPPGTHQNHWGRRFYYGDFERTFEDGTAQFTRIPVENDVEYLFVEGIYYTWKATGDDQWMEACLGAAIRALEYSISSPYRWSEKYQLLKRGHTIDTWDFQNDEDCLADFAGWNDPMAIHPEKTRFGVMFGDNTGYAVSCEYLAEMLARVGREKEAQNYRKRSKQMRERLNQLSWNGRYFTHHVPEDTTIKRDLGVDEATQVSLSNAYSLNRRIDHTQCVAILKTYQEIKANLPPGSPAEWYLIYPPFLKGYGSHNDIWQYMNGGVSPIVAGELAHGAFEHGFEGYGVDILQRVNALAQKYGNQLWECYTGAFPPPPPREFKPIDLHPYANSDVSLISSPAAPDWIPGAHPELLNLPKGFQTFQDIPFQISSDAKGALAIANRQDYAQQIEIPIHSKINSCYLLHTMSRARNGIAGTFSFIYEDGSRQTTYIREYDDILPINHWVDCKIRHDEHRKIHAEIAWQDHHPDHLNLYVVVAGFDNPHPEKQVKALVFSAAEDGTLWFILGLTLCDAAVFFQAHPISFGIPRGWGAAACTYALIEGLAGVVDEDVAFNKTLLAPRWIAAGVNHAAVTVHYPASDGYLAYIFLHDVVGSCLSFQVTGSGDHVHAHVLLPPNIQFVNSVKVDGKPVSYHLISVEQSLYVDFDLDLNGTHAIKIDY